jgi:hypothetical protein
MPDGLDALVIKFNAPTFALSADIATLPQASVPVFKASPETTAEALRVQLDSMAKDAVAMAHALMDSAYATMALVEMIAHSPVVQMIVTAEESALKENVNASLDTLVNSARSHRVSTVAQVTVSASTAIAFVSKDGRDPLANDRRVQTM